MAQLSLSPLASGFSSSNFHSSAPCGRSVAGGSAYFPTLEHISTILVRFPETMAIPAGHLDCFAPNGRSIFEQPWLFEGLTPSFSAPRWTPARLSSVHPPLPRYLPPSLDLTLSFRPYFLNRIRRTEPVFHPFLESSSVSARQNLLSPQEEGIGAP